VGFAYPDPVAVCIDVIAVPEPKTVKNCVHLDLATTSAAAQAGLVARLQDLGATPADVGQGDVSWIVLADPEGNEFCVLAPWPGGRDTGPVAGGLPESFCYRGQPGVQPCDGPGHVCPLGNG